jgi:hypothetical protein
MDKVLLSSVTHNLCSLPQIHTGILSSFHKKRLHPLTAAGVSDAGAFFVYIFSESPE